jgi:hypothetical protein
MAEQAQTSAKVINGTNRVGRFFINAVELMVDGGFTGVPFGAPIFLDGVRLLGGEAKLAKAHAEGDPQ